MRSRAPIISPRLDVLIAFALSSILCGCGSSEQKHQLPSSTADLSSDQSAISSETEQRIKAFCGACHAMPKSDSFPKDAWYDEVKRGFAFYEQSGRKDLAPPQFQEVLKYFRNQAPATLALETSELSVDRNPLRFRINPTARAAPKGDSKAVAVSFVRQMAVAPNSSSDLLFSDMSGGGIFLWNPNIQDAVPRKIVSLRNPAVASLCDLDRNGLPDLVVADLGSFQPADHDRGRVVWLADVQHIDPSENGLALCEGLGRVADVQPADFDSDGDTDLVVAEFGWHQTGRIVWLRNDGDPVASKFALKILDSRPGAIHVPVSDLNGDGRPDFVALISQEFEVVEAFLNRGNGLFEKQRVFCAEDPAFGSSGIQLVDLDRDGDQDVLLTNGDTFDSNLIKPYHGIQWLENPGSFPFIPHRLVSMPGVHRALAGDLDGDGDLDIVACSLLPATTRNEPVAAQLDSVIWLEQRGAGKFTRHVIEKGNCVHAALELADLDGDGDLDIAVGCFQDGTSSIQTPVMIWWNQLR